MALQEAREALRVRCHLREIALLWGTTPSLSPAVSPRAWGTHSNPCLSQLGSHRRQPGLAGPTAGVGAMEGALKGSQPSPPLPFSPPGEAEKPPCETAAPPPAVPREVKYKPPN